MGVRLRERGVSVPLRGFRGLQASGSHDPLVGILARFQSPYGVLGVCRTTTYAVINLGSVVSVPLRGFRGLQERIAKSTRVVWLPYPTRSLHSSCIVVHLFFGAPPRNHHRLTISASGFRNSANTPKMASSCERFPVPFLRSVICYFRASTISTARSCALTLSCFGRVAKRPRESAIFAVPAESKADLGANPT